MRPVCIMMAAVLANGVFAYVPRSGYNYLERLYDEHHEKYPHWCIYGSETSSTVQSRGVYHFPADVRLLTFADMQCSSLSNCSTNWGAKNPTVVITGDRDTPFSLGQFIWTGWDYIGDLAAYNSKDEMKQAMKEESDPCLQ